MNIVGWVLIGLGVLFLGIGVWLLSTAYASTTWPAVEGKIVEAKVVARIGQAGDALRRHLEYSVEVTYEYEVNQVSHQAKRYSLGSGDTVIGGFNEKEAARAWLKDSDFQNNSVVKVHVDPKDPTNTVLSAGIKWSTFMPVILGMMLLLMGYFIRSKLAQT